MWLQNVESCGQNSPKITVTWLHFFYKIAAIFKKMQSFFKIYHHICEFCGHFSNFAVIFQKLQSRDCRFWKIVVTYLKVAVTWLQSSKCDCNCWKLQSHFELWLQFSTFCGHISKFAITLLQLSTFCSHISNYDCNFQHFAVIFRIMTAKCWDLQSHLGLLKLSAPHRGGVLCILISKTIKLMFVILCNKTTLSQKPRLKTN